MLSKGLMSSDKDCWKTPQDLFDELNAEFHFTLDAAASSANAKCEQYFTKEQDALTQSWFGNIFVNPPYGRVLPHFVAKAFDEAKKSHLLVVMLIPARTDTSYWHDYIFPNATDIRFLRGRIKFELDGNPRDAAPFPSAVIVFDYRE